MSTPRNRLSRTEKVGYSLGDIATNFFFMSMILYQTRFYTDTVGLSAAGAVGNLFLLVRGADAIFDPIVGALSDRTNTRWGRFGRGSSGPRCPSAWSSGWSTARPTRDRAASWSTPPSPTSCHDAVLGEQHAVLGPDRAS
jgi:hypothetical protein